MKYIECDAGFLKEHKEKLIELYRILLEVDYPEEIEALVEIIPAKVNNMINYVAASQGVVIAAVENNEVLGYVHGYIRDFLGEKRTMLDGIVVGPKYQRRSIGKRLEEELERFARKNDCKKMELFVTVNNPAGEAFHVNNGYQVCRKHMMKTL